MAWEIPLRLLPLRATVKRYNKLTAEYDQVVYTNLPGRIALHRETRSIQQDHISSSAEYTLFICNYLFGGTPVEILFEDQIVIGAHTYRVLKVSDAESANHHFECEVEQLKTMSTPST